MSANSLLTKKDYNEELVQILQDRGIGNPSQAVDDDETFRGFVTSVVNGVIVASLSFVGLNYLGMDPGTVAFLFSTLIGTITSYMLDIVFAKKKFKLEEYQGIQYDEDDEEVEVDYGDILLRLTWLLQSFGSPMFTKFLVVAAIDSAVYLVLLDFLRKKLDQNKIKFKFRDLLLIMALPSITFFLYVNQLRFRWAYDSKDNSMMNILMFIWLTILIILNFIYFGIQIPPAVPSENES